MRDKEDIRVLVVDDSAVIRAIVCDLIEATPGMVVAGKARDGVEALKKVASLQPDVVTLDLQMPGLDGLTVLDTVLRENPLPIIMVSALTQSGAAVTLDALDRGAVDYVAKPERGLATQAVFAEELIPKIRAAAGMNVRRMMERRKARNLSRTAAPRPEKPSLASWPEELADKCIAIGVSTGGPPALTRLLSELRPPLPPIVIVQHMPPQFTGPLAARLDSVSALSVREASQGDVIQPNHAFVAPGGRHLELIRSGSNTKLVIRDGEPVSGHKPSADVMMKSVARSFGPNCLGVIMTGMGRDGAAGCRAIREAGGYVLGQDEASSDVYGMNKVAFTEGNVDQQFSLSDAATTISRRVPRMGCVATTLP